MAIQLRYPIRKLDQYDDYLEIKVIQYKAPEFNVNDKNLNVSTSSETLKDSGNIKNPLITIQLPMPQGISDSSAVAWGEDSLNTAEAFGASLISKDLTSGNMVNALANNMSEIGKALSLASSSGVAQQAILSKFTSSLVNSAGGNTTMEGLMSRSTGKVLNPHMELLFKSVSLRSFPFSFDFAPRDSKEALVVKQIIRTFKKHMAAKAGKGGVGEGAGGVFISSPEVFQLTYKTGARKHRFLNSFKPMALQNMAVNYTGSGTYATYEDSTPVHMQLTLQFQELNPIYFEDYDDEKDTGVGY